MHIPTFIERKRDGGTHTTTEIAEFVRGFTTGAIPEYQVAAWAMAVFFRGLTPEEISALTGAMMRSGRTLAHPAGSPPKVDKHSTGGIGDKVSLVLAPLLACDDLWVPMISGRGLGITGGTLDKLESIPGFRVGLSESEVCAQLRRLGVVMIGQTEDLCPADRRLYGLRDVTGTVPSIPLIVASIMSKKLAESLDRLVLDVKFGSGAFMQTRADAAALAIALTAVGTEMGVATSHRLTPMDEPHGFAVGNALEVAEAVDTLNGSGPADLVELILDLAERVANVSRVQLAQWLNNGTAWRKFVSMVEAQGGEASALEQIREVHRAPMHHEICAAKSGRLTRMDAGAIGRACLRLGAGRATVADRIDPRVGCELLAKCAQEVVEDQPLLRLHARSDETLRVALRELENFSSIE